MPCCGQKRQAMSASAGASMRTRTQPSTTAAFANAAQRGDVRLHYRGRGRFTMRSVGTGRSYGCGATGTIISVDPRDAESLIRTRLFTRA